MPLISVVMPAYNAEKYIRQAVMSVIEQTFTDWELIIVNDCSTDNTRGITEELKSIDKRIKSYDLEINSGVSFARNFGVEKAEGKWIAFLDSDDLWLNNKLKRQTAIITEFPEVVLSYTASYFINSYGEKYGYVLPAIPQMTYKELLKKNLISCSSVLIKKDIIANVKMHSDKTHEDYVAWLTVLKQEKYAYGINEPLIIYRLSINSKSSGRLKSAMMSYNSYRSIGYNPVISTVYVLRYAVHSISKRRKIKNSKGC